MNNVHFLHHENPPTWAGVELANLGGQGQRQTNYATQMAGILYIKSLNNSRNRRTKYFFNTLQGIILRSEP
ncbi:hypothetical protein TNCV_1069491 [Trichonephila clavipes]|nr:hypothetical protein TNCV_1069491 [Trichonephila clavipes]